MAKKQNTDTEVVEVTEIQRFEKPELSGVLAQAEIDSQIATARKYPRDIGKFKAKCLDFATIDQDTAASCFYTLPRAGRTIEGPSVRLAEIALSCYRNCIAQGDVSHEDGKFVYAVGMARDLENNVAFRIAVRRRITDKNGNRFNDDMIAVTANAAVSIALRNAIFKVVPAAYIKPVLEACKQVAAGKAASLNQAKAAALKYLTEELGIETYRILAALNRNSVEDISKADIITLRGFCTAIKDGEAEIDTIFPPGEIAKDESNEIETKEIKKPKAQSKKTKKPRSKTKLF